MINIINEVNNNNNNKRPRSESFPNEHLNVFNNNNLNNNNNNLNKASDITYPGGFRRHHINEFEHKKPSKDIKEQIINTLNNIYDPFINAMITQDNDNNNNNNNHTLHEKIQYLLETPTIKSYLTPGGTYKRKPGVFDSTTTLDERTILIKKDIKINEINKENIERIDNKNKITIYHAFLALLKSFVGTGILFLPKGFKNGGILFSFVILTCIAFLTCFSMIRLLECNKLINGTYGTIGKKVYGLWGHRMVQWSIVLMQLGFCCTYIIFVAENIYQIILFYTKTSILNVSSIILIQLFIYIPLSWIRYISYFTWSNLIADGLIIYGLFYIIINSFHITSNPNHILNINSYLNQKDYTIFIGTAVFTFEGIGLVLPTYHSLNKKEKTKFIPMLISIVLGLLLFYTFFASLNYIAYGNDQIQSIITKNLSNNNNNNEISSSIFVPFGYAMAQLLSYPLFLFPAVKIIENYLLLPSHDSGKRWFKNIIRTIIVLITIFIAYYGQNHLDLFVSIVGAFCCVPLSFIYPCLFYLKLYPNASFYSKLLDYFVITIGFLIFIFVTLSNIEKWYSI